METKAEKIVKLSGIITHKAERIKTLKIECGQQTIKICVLNERIKELEAERTRYRNCLEFLVVSKANDRVKMECIKRALKG